MLIRIRSKDGNFRLEVNPTDDGSVLAKKITELAKDADPKSITISNQPRGGELPLTSLNGRTVANLGLKHGDLIFLGYKSTESAEPSAAAPMQTMPLNGTAGSVAAASDATSTITEKRPWDTVQEDAVDTILRERDGKIPRSRDSQFCKHGANGMCDYCMPLEPYDQKYHLEHNIKHLSFHSYIRKLAPTKPGAKSSSSSYLPPLDPLSYRVKTPCPSGTHPSWPGGICSKCQPSAITLQRQPFRMVDHLEFSSPALIDRFLQGWRRTGNQRFGWLVGRYAPYDEVPLGIKAVVEAIHEPPQEGELDGLSLELPWDDEQRIEQLAHDATGLTFIGYIFTDLTPSEEDRSKSIYKRHPGSYYLSSLEVLFAATLQNKHPTPTKASSTGHFASRFVTAVLSGTPEGGIDVQAYMASEQACAMVDADMVEPSVDPNVVRVKEEEDGRYVPDVFYRFKNEYNIEVKQSAKPCFPVEYLLVTLSHGFPTEPSPVFLSHTFAIENRPGIEEQDASQVLSALGRLKAFDIVQGQGGETTKDLVRYLSDWHLLAFLGTIGLLAEGDIKLLAKTVTSPNLNDPHVLDALIATDGWQTLMTIARESAPSRPSRPAPTTGNPSGNVDGIPPEAFEDAVGFGGGGAGKTCQYCTFENPAGAVDCEVCGLPL